MLGTRIHGDINYYDQLGVDPNATPEEIRHSYRSLVRLLHPDHQTDPELKATAEKQLRKLNRIHAILMDPQQRRAYDEQLSDEWHPPVVDDAPKIRLRGNLIRGGWIFGAILAVLILFWLGTESSPMDSLPQPEFRPTYSKLPSRIDSPVAPRARGGAPTAEDVDLLRRELDRALFERDEALRALVQLRETKARESRRGLSARLLLNPQRLAPSQTKLPAFGRAAVPVITEPASSPALSSPSPQPSPVPSYPDPPVSRKFAGSWFYVPPRQGQQNKNKALYPPEFIEISIQEESGNLRGRYRARYRIPDRAISPDVNFEFVGRNNGGSCACSWRGIGGARGQIALQLSGEHTMKFDWSANEIGTQQGLASGTATLTRRAE